MQKLFKFAIMKPYNSTNGRFKTILGFVCAAHVRWHADEVKGIGAY